MKRASVLLLSAGLVVLSQPALFGRSSFVRVPANGCAFQDVPGVAWAASVQGFSTQYDNAGWAAKQALGAPNVFPRYGDIEGTWAPSSGDNIWDSIDLLFAHTVTAAEVWVFETNGAGATITVATINPDGSTTQVYHRRIREKPQAWQLVIPLGPPRPIKGVHIENSSVAVDAFAEIDAVGAAPAAACYPAPGR